MRCVSPHVSPQVVEKFCPLVWEKGKRTWACAGVARSTCHRCPRRVACLSCRLSTLTLALLLPPIPPTPFPGGEGGDQGYFMQGASPLASPGLNPRGTGAGGVSRAGGVACLSCRLPTMPLACFPAPYSPDPLPRRGRGRLKVYFAGGGAPGTPALNHLRYLQNPPSKCPAEESLLGVADCPRRRPRRGGLPPRFSSHALTGAAGCDILVYRTEPPRRTARKQKETPYRTAIPERRKGENRA